MRTASEIREMLDLLNAQPADTLEDQDLDFKEWRMRSHVDAVRDVIDMAICMANGGGGTAVFGVKDNITGRASAVLGVPPEVDVNQLRRDIYNSTDPKITPVFETLAVPEGTGRLIIMQIHPGLPPYTDTAGRAKIRIGKDCQPLTGTLRSRVMVESGESDFTVTLVRGDAAAQVSSVSMERLREIARREHAPEELLRLSDAEFLRTLGLLKAGRLTRAGVLLVGKDDLIQEAVPNYAWTYLKMCSDTDYSDRRDGREAIPAALAVLIDRIMADNPITTVEQGLFHFEYRTYPEIAIREALLNAFSHADYRIGGPVLVKHFSKRLEISNAGGFVGGISPDNILHHQPVARNPHLVDVLTRLRLVNRGNLGVQRMYSAMLMEGKEPPIIEERGESVRVVLLAGDVSVPFRVFVAEESERRRILSVDHLLILQHLVRRAEIDTATAGRICQRSEAEIREVLAEMERDLGYLDRGGTGRGTYWTLAAALYGRISKPGLSDRDRRVDWEVAKTRVLSILKQRGKHSESGLANREIRQVTRLNRAQVVRLMHELLKEDSHLVLSGKGRAAKYEYRL